MNKEQALERLSALEAEIASIKKQLEVPVKEERWRAAIFDSYLFIGICDEITKIVESATSVDNQRFNTFNYFKTKEEAERIARVQLAYRKLDWAIRQFDTVKAQDTVCGFVFYIDSLGDLTTVYTANQHSPLPRIKNGLDAEYILRNYKAELLTFLTGGEK